MIPLVNFKGDLIKTLKEFHGDFENNNWYIRRQHSNHAATTFLKSWLDSRKAVHQEERLQSVILQMCEIVVHLLSTIPVSQIFLTINKQFHGGKAKAWQITRNFPSPMPWDVTLDKASSMKCNGLDNFVVAIKWL